MKQLLTRADVDEDVDPPYLYPPYASTVLRAPQRPPVQIAAGPTELTGPDGAALIAGRTLDADLLHQHVGEPLGERILVEGRVADRAGRPLVGVLVEIWQANAAGRYAHDLDRHPAPLDPNFTGAGLCLTDSAGRYRFATIKPGAYPWRNHPNAWRPAHIHFSVMGQSFSQRLITQMYFPGDPLLAHDPIFAAVPAFARERLVASFALESTVPEWALGYRFDIILGGQQGTPPA